MNSCLTHRVALRLVAILLTFSAVRPFAAAAHEGEDHGAPEPVMVSVSGETLLAVSGGGSLFDAILKYHPFAQGETVAVTLYLVSAETNRPIADATVSASLSEGDQSTTVSFTPQPGGPVGTYNATITATTAAPMSWLFDVTANGDVDLIGVTGFQTRPLKSGPAIAATLPHRDWTALPQLAVRVAGGALLLVAAFVAGRLTARKGVSR